jgi:hypothetical protein
MFSSWEIPNKNGWFGGSLSKLHILLVDPQLAGTQKDPNEYFFSVMIYVNLSQTIMLTYVYMSIWLYIYTYI